MPLKAIFFDIDGTLYDSSTLTAMARRNSILAMIDAGLDVSEDQALRDLQGVIERFGPNYPKHYDELLRLYGKVEPKIVAAGVVAYEHTKLGYLKPFPGVVPALMELRKRHRLGVISNGLTIKQWEKLVWLRLHHFFEAVITSEECGHEKPEPEIFHAALGALDIEPSEALMVGDRYDVDIQGARKVGMRTVWFKREGEAGAGEIRSFSDLPRLVEELA